MSNRKIGDPKREMHPDFAGAKVIHKKPQVFGPDHLLIREAGSNRIVEISKANHILKVIVLKKKDIKYCCSAKTLNETETVVFELAKCRGNNFTLKYRDSFQKLKTILKELLKYNIKQHTITNKKSSYEEFLEEDILINKFYLQIVSGNKQALAELVQTDDNFLIYKNNDNYAQMIEILIQKEKDLEEKGDSYFFQAGERGRFKQYSLKDGVLVKDYGKMKRDKIQCMKLTHDYKYIFIAGKFGFLQQFDIKKSELYKDFGYVFQDFDLGDIKSMTFTNDNKYLVISNTTGYVKQFNIETHELYKDHGKLFDNEIYTITFSHNSEFLFIGGKNSNIFRYKCSELEIKPSDNKTSESGTNIILKKSVVSDENEIKSQNQSPDKSKLSIVESKKIYIGDENESNYEVYKIACLKNNHIIFVSGSKELLKEINMKTGEVLKDYKLIYASKYKEVEADITAIEITPNGKYLFTATTDSNMKQFQISKQCLVKDYGQAHDFDAKIFCIKATPDSKYLFSSDYNGYLKMWAVESMSLYKDFGLIFEGEIYAIDVSF